MTIFLAEHDQEKCPEWLPNSGEVERKLSEQELSCERDLELKETKLKTKKWSRWVKQNVDTRQEAWWLMEEIAKDIWGSEVSASTPEEMERQHYE